MGRLTKRISGYAHGAEGISKDRLTGNYCRGEFEATACVEALAEYEDLEEQGKLLKLPCKLGGTTYWISDEDEEGNKVLTVRKNNPIVGIAVNEDGIYIMADGDDDYQKVGTRWGFLTQEEAESALKTMR